VSPVFISIEADFIDEDLMGCL